MRRTVFSAVLLALALAQTAASARSGPRYGIRPDGRLQVRGVVEPAVRLEPGVAGWYLTLDVPAQTMNGTPCRATFVDVSPLPGHLPKWNEPVPTVVATSTILLDPTRYVGSHTYRMTLTCGLNEVGSGLVHLVAPKDPSIQRVFDLAHITDEDEVEVAVLPKGDL